MCSDKQICLVGGANDFSAVSYLLMIWIESKMAKKISALEIEVIAGNSLVVEVPSGFCYSFNKGVCLFQVLKRKKSFQNTANYLVVITKEKHFFLKSHCNFQLIAYGTV